MNKDETQMTAWSKQAVAEFDVVLQIWLNIGKLSLMVVAWVGVHILSKHGADMCRYVWA